MKKGYLSFVCLISILFSSTYELIISLDDYDGLFNGAKIYSEDERIGKVSKISQNDNGSWKIKLKIYNEYPNIIDDNTLFRVNASSLYIDYDAMNLRQEKEKLAEIEANELAKKAEEAARLAAQEAERQAKIKAEEAARLAAQEAERQAKIKAEEAARLEAQEAERQAKIKAEAEAREAINNTNKGDAALSFEKEYLASLKEMKEARIKFLQLELSKNKNLYNDKDQFETSSEFFIRATTSTLDYYDSLNIVIHNYFNTQIRPIEKEFENVLDKNFSSKEIDISLGDYDADLEVFPIVVKDLKNNKTYNRDINIKKKSAKKLYNNWGNIKAAGLFSLRFDGTVYLNKVDIVDELNGLEFSFIINQKEIASISTAKYFDLNIEMKNILMLRKPELPELLSYSEVEDPYQGIAINLKDTMITYLTEVNTEDSSFKGEDYGASGYQTRLNINGKMMMWTTIRPEMNYYNTVILSFDPLLKRMEDWNNNDNKEGESYQMIKKGLNDLRNNSISKASSFSNSGGRLSNLEFFISDMKINGAKIIVNNYNNKESDSYFSNVDCYWNNCRGFKKYIKEVLNVESKAPKYFYLDSFGDFWGIFLHSNGNGFYRKDVDFYDVYYDYLNIYNSRYNIIVDRVSRIKLNDNYYYSIIGPSSDGLDIGFPFLFDLDYDGYNLSSQKVSELRKNFEILNKFQGNIPETPIEADEDTEIDALDFVAFDQAPEAKRGKGVKPKYPEIAREAGMEGTVYVKFFVDEKGNVADAYVIQGVPGSGLDEAALSAVKKSMWKPAMQRDKKVGVWMTIPVSFKLN